MRRRDRKGEPGKRQEGKLEEAVLGEFSEKGREHKTSERRIGEKNEERKEESKERWREKRKEEEVVRRED